MDVQKIVSVVMPVYNEEKYIDKCIRSLLLQDYPREKMEWIFVDGMSQDCTVQILQGYAGQYPELIRIYENPDKIVPYAMNIGITNAKGKYIVRLDAHTMRRIIFLSAYIIWKIQMQKMLAGWRKLNRTGRSAMR